MTSEVKINYAYVITQDISNKFIDVNFCVGCMVWSFSIFFLQVRNFERSWNTIEELEKIIDKDDHAHDITQGICNKFIEVDSYVGCISWVYSLIGCSNVEYLSNIDEIWYLYWHSVF